MLPATGRSARIQLWRNALMVRGPRRWDALLALDHDEAELTNCPIAPPHIIMPGQ